MLKICVALNFAILKLPTDQAADNISVGYGPLMLIKIKINQMVSLPLQIHPKSLNIRVRNMEAMPKQHRCLSDWGERRKATAPDL
jgi:hypothetical protein